MSVIISGLGVAVPEHSIKQEDAARCANECVGALQKEQQLTTSLYRRSGVRTRHSVLLKSSTNGTPAEQNFFTPLADPSHRGPTTADRMVAYDAAALQLATSAAVAALRDANCLASQVTHLVTVSCSGFSAPGVDVGLIGTLGLCTQVARTHIGFMGCHGSFNGLRVARALAAADPHATVLLVAVELCSLHYQYSADPQQLVANSLFADGAGALVITAELAASSAPWRVIDSQSQLIPDTLDLMSWRIGDHGFQMTLSPKVPEIIRSQLQPWFNRWLHTHQLQVSDITNWAVHPGGPRILDACEQSLDLSAGGLEQSRVVLRRYGNMSSPTVLFILKSLRQASQPGPCVMLGFGPGLTIEAALLNQLV